MRAIAATALVALSAAACSPASQDGAAPRDGGPTSADPAPGFRAIGQEPGWLAEVARGDAPAIRLLLDHGERRLTLPRSTAFDQDGNRSFGYRGMADGLAVELRIHRETCHDTMSGEAFETRVELRVGEERFDGCGMFLP
ncbi:MAG: hypothetical protein ACK4RW_05735 [Rehaibacterium terrae]|uniref:hypothetical protein n=1 Tax=Rehaibacterium terrae TaxID=1341696 RepID=UPI00391C5BF6